MNKQYTPTPPPTESRKKELFDLMLFAAGNMIAIAAREAWQKIRKQAELEAQGKEFDAALGIELNTEMALISFLESDNFDWSECVYIAHSWGVRRDKWIEELKKTIHGFMMISKDVNSRNVHAVMLNRQVLQIAAKTDPVAEVLLEVMTELTQKPLPVSFKVHFMGEVGRGEMKEAIEEVHEFVQSIRRHERQAEEKAPTTETHIWAVEEFERLRAEEAKKGGSNNGQ